MHATAALLLTGAIAGLTIAMPIGPFCLLCIQRSLRGGFLAGFSTGLGGATVSVTQAIVFLLGLQRLLPAMPGSGGKVLSALGSLMLLWSAVRTWRAHLLPTGSSGSPAASGYAPAYLSGAAFNAVNPLAAVLLLAALSPVLGAGTPPRLNSVVLVAGMAAASCAWYAGLTLFVSVVRARLSLAFLKGLNRVAGGALAIYAAATLAGACGI